MSEPKHTPGPWRWEPDGETGVPDIWAESGAFIAEVNPWPPGSPPVLGCGGDPEANARLIAAAPELLAACERAYSLIGPQHIGPSLEVSQMLATAIRKAKGDS